MNLTLPRFSQLDPIQSSEGNLDPMGLYQIADQLAVALIPAIRERMSRIRFLTAITVGAVVREDLPVPPDGETVDSYLPWEWLVVESFLRSFDGHEDLRGIPGSMMTRRALENHGYLDAASYLKTPRIFGFHGVYKRLAIHLGLVDAYLNPGPRAGILLEAWAIDQGFDTFEAASGLIDSWRQTVARALRRTPANTKGLWVSEEWKELSEAFYPALLGRQERRALLDLLLDLGDSRLGAVGDLWPIVQDLDPSATIDERTAHTHLMKRAPEWKQLLQAIAAYESFARTLQDSFDVLRQSAQAVAATSLDLRHLESSDIIGELCRALPARCEAAGTALSRGGPVAEAAALLFQERFGGFLEPTRTVRFGHVLLEHHEKIQRAKSAEGKRTWLDRVGDDGVFLRLPYRLPDDWAPSPDRYLHPYRLGAIASFQADLA